MTDPRWLGMPTKGGAKVEIIRVKGIKYLRTDGNSTEADNLGELPEFQCR